jgi:hypothetical protein
MKRLHAKDALLLALILLGGTGSVGSWGAAPERVAQLGLVPRTDGTPEAWLETPDGAYSGLKLPRSGAPGAAPQSRRNLTAGGASLYGVSRELPPFGASNAQQVGGVLYPLTGSWFSSVETTADSGSPGAGRGYGLLGQVHRTLPGGFALSAGLRYRVLESGPAPLPSGAPEASTFDRSWALYPPAAGSGASAGYELRLNYRYGERNTLGLTYGSGNEADYTRQMLGLQATDGRQFGLTGEHWLTPDWALNYGVMAQEQVGPHRGQGLRLGLRYRF